MTTVIADLRTLTMGADRLSSMQGFRTANTKIFKVTTYDADILADKPLLNPKETALVGIAGVLDYAVHVCEWVRKGMSPFNDIPRISSSSGDLSILVLRKDNIFTAACDFSPIVVEDYPYYAVGAGQQAAMAALYLGCDVQRALDVVYQINYYTGPSFDLLKL